MPNPSLITPSGQCSVDWLCTILPRRIFGGDIGIDYNDKTKDVRPVVVTWDGDITEEVWN